MEILKILIPIISAIITAAFAFFTARVASKHLPFHKSMKKLRIAMEVRELFNEYTGSFKEEFIQQDLKEAYFYAQTGINTNEKSIKKYIDFKNRIDKNWNTINYIKSYLNLEGSKILIELSPKKITSSYFERIFGWIIYLGGICQFYYYVQFQDNRKTDQLILSAIIMILLLIFGLFIIYHASSVFIARSIKNKLSKSR